MAATTKRLDLQGLRAVAVLLVALDHANVPFLRGGYVGVDVFFVLSGYFITGLLLREGVFGGSASGRISIPKFYARRARRILPAAALTLAATSIAVYVIYDVMRADYLGTGSTLMDTLASALFFANVHFAATATNYFAQASSTMPSPVQHFWSLSVEEQFYLIWPSLLAGTFLICRRCRGGFNKRTASRAAGVLIATVCIASLAWSIHSTQANPQSAYFSTFARAWELGIGAGLALIAPRAGALPASLSIALGWLGGAMIAAASVLYSSATPFPGDAALLPVIGAGLIIAAGIKPSRTGIARLLGVAPLTYIGDRSYTFYLWHYPTLILAWQAAGHELGVGVNLVLIAGAFGLSIITYGVYENPLRHASFLRGWRTAAMVPVSLAATVAAVMVPIVAFQASLASEALASGHVQPLRAAQDQADPTNLWDPAAVPQVVAATEKVKSNAPIPKVFLPSMARLEHENTNVSYDIPSGCQPSFGSGITSNVCRLGDPNSSRVVAVLGDSHAGMWMPALIADARKQHFAVVPLDKPGCFVNRLNNKIAGWPCGSWYKWALSQADSLHPAATIVTFKLGSALQKHPVSTVADIRDVLKRVPSGVYLADPPAQAEQPATCITKPNATLRSCSAEEPASYPTLMKDIAKMTHQIHDPAMPTVQWFCADQICPTIVDRTLTTHDGDHLTMEYGADLAPVLGHELGPILAKEKLA
ncbi:MAG TPA: acyltransferase family protein [Solirubrobacteraceae bacterium]|jgi:peptidoglycan/LPS O-acetylase OafA/YrhL|nr:acyltransferase family protein [Solirubrobacteraceae bacterium]